MSGQTDRNKGLLSRRMLNKEGTIKNKIPRNERKQTERAAGLIYRLEKAINTKDKENIIGCYEWVYAQDWWNGIPKSLQNKYLRLGQQGNEILGLNTQNI